VGSVLARRPDQVDVTECNWAVAAFDSAALKVSRTYCPKGRNLLV
jgi:hypothetical protein